MRNKKGREIDEARSAGHWIASGRLVNRANHAADSKIVNGVPSVVKSAMNSLANPCKMSQDYTQRNDSSSKELRRSSTSARPTSLCRKSTPNTFQPPAKNRARTAEPTPAWDETNSSYVLSGGKSACLPQRRRRAQPWPREGVARHAMGREDCGWRQAEEEVSSEQRAMQERVG